jgi:TnsA endonuclease-like protein
MPPVRRLKKSHKNVTGLFYSRKLGRHVQFDSMLERDFILLLDTHPVVLNFSEQPFHICWFDHNGEPQSYCPDFEVTFGPGIFLGRQVHRPWIVETKYRNDLAESWTSLRPKIQAGFANALERGATFHLITEEFLQSNEMNNAKFLRRFQRAFSGRATEAIVERLQKNDGITAEELILSLAETGVETSELTAQLWGAVSHGRVTLDWEQPISLASPIRAAERRL